MASTMKLFRTLQKFYAVMGLVINPSQSSREKYLIGAKKIFFSFSIAQMFISSTAFFLYEAKTYTSAVAISFMTSITAMTVAVCIFNTAWKMDKILLSITKCEKFIEKR